MKKILLFSFLLGVMYVGYGQHYPLTNLNFDDGLTRASFFEISKDPQGYMWLGSETSIIRYDGAEFIQYSNRDGIKGNYVLDIDYDENGQMWVSTYGGGMARFDGTRFWAFNSENGFPGNYIRSSFRAKNGDWWISSEDVGPIWVPKGQQPLVMNDWLKLAKPIMNPWSMAEDLKGNIWVCAIGGLGKFVKSKNYAFEWVYTTPYTFTSAAIDKSGTVWAGGAYEFIKVVGDSVINLKSKLPAGTIIFDMLIHEDDGKLYLGTADKLMVSDKDTFVYLDKSNGITNAQFWEVYEDETHSVWLGSGGGGVLKYDSKGIAWYGGKDGIELESSIQDIVEDIRGRIIFGTELNGYLYFENGKMHTYSQPEVAEIVTGYATDYDPAYDLAVFTSATGSLVWLRGDKVVDHYKSERSGGVTIYGIEIVDSQSVLYSTDVGCYTMHRDSIKPTRVESIPAAFFRSIFKDGEGNYWLAGDNGDIYRYKDGKSVNFQQQLNPDKYSVLTGYYDDYYQLYFFCTNTGLIIWDGKTKFILHSGNGLGGDVPVGVTRDINMNLWITHDKGLTCLNPETKMVRHIGYDQGFRSVSVNFRSLLMSRSGKLYTSSVNELYEITLAELIPDNLHTVLRLQEIFFRDKTYFKENYFTSELPTIYLDHNENNFQVDLAALDFVNAAKVKYTWILEGFDEDYMPYTHLNEINYTNLPPGDYVFKAKAIDSEGFETNEVSIQIIIAKPFWEKLWFYLLEIGIFLTIVLLSFAFSGKQSNNRFGQIMTFLTIIIFFESMIFYLSDFINPLTNGIPVFQLVMNIVLAAVLQPVERIVKNKFKVAIRKNRQ